MDEFLFWIAGGYGIRPYVFRIAVYMQCILTSSAGASPSPVAIIDCSPLWLRPLRHANACQSSAPVAIIDCSPLWLQTVHWTVCLTRRAQSERLSARTSNCSMAINRIKIKISQLRLGDFFVVFSMFCGRIWNPPLRYERMRINTVR